MRITMIRQCACLMGSLISLRGRWNIKFWSVLKDTNVDCCKKIEVKLKGQTPKVTVVDCASFDFDALLRNLTEKFEGRSEKNSAVKTTQIEN